jgi:hypothetical protein
MGPSVKTVPNKCAKHNNTILTETLPYNNDIIDCLTLLEVVDQLTTNVSKRLALSTTKFHAAFYVATKYDITKYLARYC